MITLDGKSLKEFGLVAAQEGQQYEILPVTEDHVVQIAGRNGKYYFGADLAERKFAFPLAWMQETSRNELQKKIRNFSKFLLDPNGKPRKIELRFDYEPDKFYYVRYSGSIMPERLLSVALFTLPLVAYDPYAYANLTAYDVPPGTYDTGLQYDSGLMYENPESFNWTHQIQYSGAYNYGMETPLTLTIQGTVTNPKITNIDTGESLTISTSLSNATIKIDSDKMTVLINGANGMQYVSGNFISLQPGDNGFRFEGTSPSATVTFHWKNRYL